MDDAGSTARSISSAVFRPDLMRYYTVAFTFDLASQVLDLHYWPREQGQYPRGSLVSATPVDLGAGAITPQVSTRALKLGAGIDASSLIFAVGNVDITEVAIYNSALSSSAVAALLDYRLTGAETGQVAYWRADEGRGGIGGATLYDRGGTGINGTLENGARWCDDPTDLKYSTGKFRYGVVGWADQTKRRQVTITASTEAAGYPASLLRDPRRISKTRTTVDTVSTWTYYFGAPVPLSLLYFTHNLTSAATITVSLHTADSWGSPAVSETVTFHPGFIAHFFARTYQYAYMRLSLTDAANPATYLELGALAAFHCWEPADPPSMTDTLNFLDDAVAVTLPHGQRWSRDVGKPRGISFAWAQMDRSDAYELSRLGEHMLGAGWAWACPNVGLSLYDLGIYGQVMGDLTNGGQDASGTLRSGLGISVIEEAA
jgi:hypothetical protein